MDTLTAPQLHALVAEPFEMPDGSKRRALWERVPECRPDDNGEPVVLDGVEPLRLLGWGREIIATDGAAAALIRVAIEDWVGDHLPDGDMAKGVAPEGGYWVGEYIEQGYDIACRTHGRGPTRLHALVHAAHAVADALGIPQ